MAKRLMSLLYILLGIVVLALAVAWFDGGREEQRLIVEPVDLQGERA